MNSKGLKKYVTDLYDEKGKLICVQLNLRNKIIRNFYAQLMEDLEDTLDSIEAMKDKETVSWEVVQADLEAKWSEE